MAKSKKETNIQEDTIISAGLSRGYFSLVEGVFDPGILKCIFTAGGPGSGKSAVAANLFDFAPDSKTLSALGLKPVTSDAAFVHLLKKAGIPLNLAKIPDDLFKQITNDKDPNSIRSKAKRLMGQQFLAYQHGRLGMILDGTGDEETKIKNKKEQLEALGYDCYMVFVQTSLKIALQRNKGRDRVLPKKIVKNSWHESIENIAPFMTMFGKANFSIINNSKDTRDPETAGKMFLNKTVMKECAQFIKAPIKNPIGKKWIELEKGAAALPKGTAKAIRTGDQLNQKNEIAGPISIPSAHAVENVKLPMDLERYLNRTMFIIRKFDLQPNKNLAILSRFVDSMELNQNEFIRYFNKIRKTNFGPARTKTYESNETNEIISELLAEGLGLEWSIELAKPGEYHSYALKKTGNQRWAQKLAEKLVKDKNDYEFIGIFTEGETDSGPILEGEVYHCTKAYLKKSPYMYFEKKDACKTFLKSGKPQEYIEG